MLNVIHKEIPDYGFIKPNSRLFVDSVNSNRHSKKLVLTIYEVLKDPIYHTVYFFSYSLNCI